MENVEIPEGLEDLFKQTVFDHILHYGLLLGAIFQLVCIAAIIFIPPSSGEEDKQDTMVRNPCHTGETSISSEDGVETNNAGSGVVVGGGARKGGKKARKRK